MEKVRVLVLVLVLVLCSSAFAGMSDPRTWGEDMSSDPLGTSDWQTRSGYPSDYDIADGLMSFNSDWQLIDTAAHYFLGTTIVDMDWAAAPVGTDNPGVGWWLNIANDGSTGGMSTIYCILGRDSSGNQKIDISNGDHSVITTLAMAEGVVAGSVTMSDYGGGLGGSLSYSFTDSAGTTAGSYPLIRQTGMTGDPYFTLVAFDTGRGSIDNVTVTNSLPEPMTIALLGLGGLLLRRRK